MSGKDLLLILILVAVWGFNFVAIRLGLDGFPPLLLCALRFIFSALPAVFFIRRPPCSWRLLIAFGFVIFACQFSFLFSGMAVGMSPGLASLVMQVQVFFTMGLAAWLLKDRPTPLKIIGAVISFSGILLVGLHTQGEVTPAGLTLTLLAALSWGTGNIISKRIGAVPPLALVVWGSLIAAPFLIVLSLFVDGPSLIVASLAHLSLVSALSIAYLVYASTHLGYSLWGHLLNRYSTASVAPFTLLVPIFGFLGSVVMLHEAVPLWKVGAGALVVAGLSLNVLAGKLELRGRRQITH